MTSMVLFAACGSVLTAAPAGEAPLRMYTQQVEIDYASEADAAKATFSFAPVYDSKPWALSARWDDCNDNSLVMREHMAKYGLKGTFYLNATRKGGRFGRDYALKVTRGGFSVGGHSQTHPKFPECTPSKIFWEVLANRVEREAQTDRPINSFAFPYGQYKSKTDPVVIEAVTCSLRRAGYHHCVYQTFLKKNPFLAPDEFSTGLQVVPGDRKVNAKRFEQHLDKIFKWPDAYAKTSRCVFLGVHVWQRGEEWAKLDAVFEALRARCDWWCCNQTQYAAYVRQVRNSRVSASGAGATRTYTLTRPTAADLGDDVALTCLVADASVRAVRLDGRPVPCRAQGGAAVVNLAHGAGHGLPVKIAQTDGAGAIDDFPGLAINLACDSSAGRLRLSCVNGADADLRDVHITFRLPPLHEQGLVVRRVDALPAKGRQTVELPLPPARQGEAWRAGPHYYVAEVDFQTPDGLGRVFATTRVQ